MERRSELSWAQGGGRMTKRLAIAVALCAGMLLPTIASAVPIVIGGGTRSNADPPGGLSRRQEITSQFGVARGRTV